MTQFTHLHCHTQFSLLDGAAKIANLIGKAKHMGMGALAITDHGNMFGVPQFVSEAKKQGVKPIIGCEFYLTKDRHDRSDNTRYHQIILAKNKIGYHNLVKLCSLGYTEGYYYKPRIDMEAILRYREGLMATTCCLGSEVCKTIIKEGEEKAETCFLKWLEVWGEDYYIELQPEYIEEVQKCNEILKKWSTKYKVPTVATNDVHYVESKDSVAQDILICLQTGTDYNDPSRMKFVSNQYFLKSADEMLSHFPEVPESIFNTQQIVEKVEDISLERDVLMPIYEVPAPFESQSSYLKHLTYEGARRRYAVLTPDVDQRIAYELSIIEKMGFEGYFLVVQDFILAAKNLGVAVGPGRGSVVGSIVAYCIGITSICPLEYNLIFERFLNPERVSLPDIDIDFDDVRRDRVIQYVVEKYGKNQVAQIITFGSMGAKSAIKDVARVLGLPLEKANYLAKLIPEKPGFSLARAFKEVPEMAKVLAEIDTKESKVLALAETLEGSARHAGVHAAGIIIAPEDLTNFIPVKKDKDSDLLVTQYDGSVVESLGMLKMDFLGLRTLSVVHDAVALIKKTYGIEIDLDSLPLDDAKTYELYQKGDTIGTFQFESDGMRQWLVKLQPTNIEELIAMNALYRPGPMQFIPNFIARKHGKEVADCPHPLLEDVVKNTYGIMIYQEQIIRAAQVMAGYTAGGADILRKAMGKKKPEEMERQKELFIQGAKQHNNVDREKALEVFEVMEKFAQYGFNRSHSTAYAILAYQSAYLKANFMAEYMAVLLSHHNHDFDKITVFVNDCRKHGIEILGPDVNKSDLSFSVTEQKKIRFGLAAIKGIGTATAEAIINMRGEGYSDFFDFIERVGDSNKKTLEALVMSGAFDSFKDLHRRQYVTSHSDEPTFIDRSLKYLHQLKSSKQDTQLSLFDLSGDTPVITIKRPEAQKFEPYTALEQLAHEREMLGFYLSGHPLDGYDVDIKSFCNVNTQTINSTSSLKEVRIVGIISSLKRKATKAGKPYAKFTLEDKHGTIDIALFGESYQQNNDMLINGAAAYITGSLAVTYASADSQELKVQKILPLESLRKNLCKHLRILIDVAKFDSESLAKLEELLKKYSGDTALEVCMLAMEEKMQLNFSTKMRVTLDGKFLSGLEKIKAVSVELTAKG